MLKRLDLTFLITIVIVFLTLVVDFSPSNTGRDPFDLRTLLESLNWEVGRPVALAQSHSAPKGHPDSRLSGRSFVGSHLSMQEVEQLLSLHNKARADVGVGPVTWSKKLALYAQEWANHLATTNCKLQHRPNSGKWRREHGENLFMGTIGHYGVADAVKSWESERRYYRGQTLTASNFYESGHYTQVVWKNTKQIGCAKAECHGNVIIVCNYDPPGNILGQRPY